MKQNTKNTWVYQTSCLSTEDLLQVKRNIQYFESSVGENLQSDFYRNVVWTRVDWIKIMGVPFVSMWIKRPFHFQHSEGVKSRIFLSFQRYPQSFTLLQKKEVKSATQLEYDVFLFQDTPPFCWACFNSEYLNLRSHSYERKSLFLTYLPFERGSSIPNYR